MYTIRPWLTIGKYAETRNLNLLQVSGIHAMLQLAEAVPQPGIESLYLAVEDGEPLPIPLLEQGITFIREQKSQDHHVMVACGAGISRSVLFSMAALMAEENLSLFDAYRDIVAIHPTAMPHHALGLSLAQYHHLDLDLRGYMDGLMKVRKDTG
jgi:protein-tyrosine phosphatase